VCEHVTSIELTVSLRGDQRTEWITAKVEGENSLEIAKRMLDHMMEMATRD
jgi:hypothetical protein